MNRGGERRSKRILAFRPECNPPAHTTPASRTQPATANTSPRPPLLVGEGQLDNTVGAPMADTLGPTRRSLAPAANTSPHPPLTSRTGQFDNTEGAASRKAITSSTDTMRQSANRHKTTQPTTASRANAGHDYRQHHRGTTG